VANCRGAASRKEVGAARSRSHRPVATRGPPPTQQSNLISLSISTVSRSRRWRHRWRDPQTARPARRRRPGGGGVRWAAGEEFDTSPKRIKTPACAARGAVLVCSVCVSLSLSPLIISSAIPFALPSPRGRHSSFFIHPSAAPGATGQQLSTLIRRAREKTAGWERTRRRSPRSAARRLPIHWGATTGRGLPAMVQ
jgi:hypothetical protein